MSGHGSSETKVPSRELLKALKDLVAAAGFVTPLQFNCSVKGIRNAGKFVKAYRNAIDVIARAAKP